MNILFAASEAFPFIKTGGLGDVVHSLPIALHDLGDDVRLVLPAYRDVLAGVDSLKELGYWDIPGVGKTHRVNLLQAHQDSIGDYLYLIDAPSLFDRPGNPYVHESGLSWPDNAERSTVFSRAVAEISKNIPNTEWHPDVVHCHDWQTGMIPAFISMRYPRPKSVFTIHNLAYDGHFSHGDFNALSLPPEWWTPEHVEFYGGFSMLKAGMVFSDQVTTVSPTYAEEICTPEFGYRFEGILKGLGGKLSGILNGIDKEIWNPKTDKRITHNYSIDNEWEKRKAGNKKDLLKRVRLPQTDAPLLGFVGRMVEQKGVDMIIAALPALFDKTDVSVIILGSGDRLFEADFNALAQKYPDRLHVHIGYSEDLAHQVEAGCDMFLMPSRFEPCGLNQMYSLRYGTPPVVTRTGGLADTVIDTTAITLKNGTATGFVLDDTTTVALYDAIDRALKIYRKPKQWRQVCETAMRQDFGWKASAKRYQALYQE